jgi:hypothetical protein
MVINFNPLILMKIRTLGIWQDRLMESVEELPLLKLVSFLLLESGR